MPRFLVAVAAALVAFSVLEAASPLGTMNVFADVDSNVLRTGVLVLDLDGTRTASRQLAFTNLVPGERAEQVMWVPVNESRSAVPARLVIRIHDVVDSPARCAVSHGKAAAEIASGIAGCSIGSAGISGTPVVGVLSRIVDADIRYDPTPRDPASCATDRFVDRELLPSYPGNLHALATRDGIVRAPADDRGHAIVLPPRKGACVAMTVIWPELPIGVAGTPQRPLDDAAQGDSITLTLTFELEQHDER